MNNRVFEILSWVAKSGVTDVEMVDVMEDFGAEVRLLPGFIQQSLYKNAQGVWVCVYYWETEEQAHNSNELVADNPVFHSLMALIEADTVTMEVMHPLQQAS